MFGDPRSVRVNKILDSGVMDLQVEKFTQLNIAPTTKYDLYHHELRSLPPTIKQIGVPVDLEQREMETNTEEITMVDSGMQFSYGDDTALYMAIENIKNKDGKNTSKASLEKRDIAASSTGDATKLTSFLQRTSYLFDTLLNERNNKEDEGKRDTDDNNRYALFDREVEWLRLGLGKADGSNELLKTRGTVSARFSELQPHIVVTAHPFPEGDAAEEDLRPYMVIVDLDLICCF